MISSPTRPRPPAPPAALALLALLAGCQAGTDGPLARWRMNGDHGIAKAPTVEELGDQSRGLMSRWLHPGSSAHPDMGRANAPGLVNGSDGYNPMKPPSNPAAEAELKVADDLFRKGQLKEAEKAFAQIAKDRKGTPWGEKAAYYKAEARYQQANYVGAHDAYEELFADYPGTQHLEKSVAREFAIANDWLTYGKPGGRLQPKFDDRVVGRVPLIDTSGHALQVLEHVRHHDPTGPLADDAVLQIADYHFGVANYEDAAIYYDELLADHPKSPFYQRALNSSIDSKMKGYLGPDYDGGGLDQAREQIRQATAAAAATGADEAVSKAMYNNLALINEQQAERSYHDGEFYRRTGYVQAAEYCFAEIPVRWPKSPWAKKAKTQLAQLAKMPRKEVKPSKIMGQPGSSDPYNNGISSGQPGGSTGGMSGAGIGSPTGP